MPEKMPNTWVDTSPADVRFCNAWGINPEDISKLQLQILHSPDVRILDAAKRIIFNVYNDTDRNQVYDESAEEAAIIARFRYLLTDRKINLNCRLFPNDFDNMDEANKHVSEKTSSLTDEQKVEISVDFLKSYTDIFLPKFRKDWIVINNAGEIVYTMSPYNDDLSVLGKYLIISTRDQVAFHLKCCRDYGCSNDVFFNFLKNHVTVFLNGQTLDDLLLFITVHQVFFRPIFESDYCDWFLAFILRANKNSLLFLDTFLLAINQLFFTPEKPISTHLTWCAVEDLRMVIQTLTFNSPYKEMLFLKGIEVAVHDYQKSQSSNNSNISSLSRALGMLAYRLTPTQAFISAILKITKNTELSVNDKVCQLYNILTSTNLELLDLKMKETLHEYSILTLENPRDANLKFKVNSQLSAILSMASASVDSHQPQQPFAAH